MQNQSYIVTLDVDSVCYLLSFKINYKVLAGSHKMGRVDTQLIGFFLSPSFFPVFFCISDQN